MVSKLCNACRRDCFVFYDIEYNSFVFVSRIKQESMSLMKFMGMNFLKDILWVVFWMFFIRDNSVLVIFIATVFFLLSIPLYISVLSGIRNNQKSDKNQS